MKKLALIAAAFVATATMTFAGIDGSAHDFVNGTMNNAANQFGSRICGPCHVPHNANGATPPLWGHTETAEFGYTYYDLTGTKNADPTSLDSYSKLCMSCHDGTIEMDSYQGNTASSGVMVGSALLGTTLTNDHPVNVNVLSAVATPYAGYKSPTNALTTGTLETVSCASCHDPHNAAGFAKLLRTTNVGSALCLDCHVK